MERFFLFTRGRTGSTAILDELASHMKMLVTMELFLEFNRVEKKVYERLKLYYRYILPYDYWLNNPVNQRRIARSQFFDKLRFQKREFDQVAQTVYINNLEKIALKKKVSGYGFKILTHQFTEKPLLPGLLKQRSFKAIYLVRKNVIKKVISGMIAKKRGIYNQKNYTGDGDNYHIDVNEFEQLVHWEASRIHNDRQILQEMGFEILDVTYEDFCEDRSAFYAKILNFLNMPSMPLTPTDFSIMIPEIGKVVSNYSELKAKAHEMGLENWL